MSSDGFQCNIRVKMLKKDKNGSPEWLSKLPQMAKQLEVSLYRNARSFEAYTDMSTLKHRLQMIAREVSKKTKSQGSRVDDRGQAYSGGAMSLNRDEPMRSSSRNESTSPYMGGSSASRGQSSSSTPLPGQDQRHQMPQQMSSHGSRQVNMDEINPMASAADNDMIRQSSGPAYMGSTRLPTVDQGLSNRSTSASVTPSGFSQGNRSDPEWKARIKHKQQRLLLLHHSAKCPHEDGRCKVTPHCADMKRLWRHMEGCKDNDCRVSHCFSSRAILSHYRKCKDAQCPACGPVRDTVRKSQSTHGSSSGRSMDSLGRPNSSGPMMNAMLNSSSYPGDSRSMSAPSTAQPHGIMSPTVEQLTAPGSFSSASSVNSSFQQTRPSARSSMPPPASQGSNMQYSVSSSNPYRSTSSTGATPSSTTPSMAQQSVYRSEQPTADQLSSGRSRSSDPSPTSSGRGSASAVPPSSSQRRDSEWQKVRHKQQRLLLLRHASKCQYEAGKCPVTPHCASMKKLWEHIAHCKDHQCTVQHCMSSRYVLSHYRRCKDPRCPACGPVRHTIRQSNENEKSRTLSSDGSKLQLDAEQQLLVSVTADMAPPEGHAIPYEPQQKRRKSDQMSGVGSMAMNASGDTMSNSAVHYRNDASSRSAARSDAVQSSKLSKSAGASESKSEGADFSLINSFTVEDIEVHLASLDRTMQLPPAKLKSKCMEVLKGLQNHQHGWVFNNPVDPVELGLPDYFEVIKKPMDLGTVQRKIDNGLYHSIEDFQTDVNLTFDNAMQYNEDGSVVHDMAKELKLKFVADYKKLLTQLEVEDRERRQNERACTLCGCEKLLFEPPVFFCNGMNCQSKRIRRNSHFYIAGSNQYFWCNQCYNELDGDTPIEFVDVSVMKDDLKKKKNDEVHEESWVQCDDCQCWIHQICGLFNTRQNKEHHSKYFCPKCLLKKQLRGEMKPFPKPPSAADLPRTILTERLEKHVREKVEEKRQQLAKDKAELEVRYSCVWFADLLPSLFSHSSFVQNIPVSEAMKMLDVGGPVIIRQVTSTDRKLEVRERMKQRYAHKNYPDEFPFRCKLIVVFQSLDGVDVLLFALYVYEHGADNPPPNQRVVYISYLDSVHFMRPRKMRTLIYHEILIKYLDYARERGFATAHIWACPPLKGDDYIFYAKPEDQKTPRDARLRQWYIDMLVECQRRNIVGKLTNMYDLYFANESLDATAVPYLEGDYFPGEAENIIKDIEDGNGKKGGTSGKKNKKKQNKAKNRGGTRSTGPDEEALIASGILAPSKDLQEGGRDEVMVKLGETIQPMKESFIVAFLNWSGAKEEDMVVPEEIVRDRQELAEKNSSEATNRKRDADGNVKGDSNETADEKGSPIKVIDDDEEDMDCEFFNNRQAFLNLCRGNHYQFDELRRAKHTSMMVLWHLHNRDAPKFVQQCASCLREILTGNRYHCETCPEFDLCEECYRSPSANRGACSHKLRPISVEGNQDGPGAGNGLTEEERRERQRNIQLHIQLIEHAARCNSPQCSSNNCAKMKSYLLHGRSCKVSCLLA